MHAAVVKVLDEVTSAWRFRWWALGVAWAVCLVGWAVVIALPNVFEARARVYVDSTSALRPLLKGLAIEPDVDSELAIVRQAILSRPQLERVARDTDLDMRAKTAADKETLINSLQQRIVVDTEKKRNRGAADGLYVISFQDQRRDKSLEVVQTLLKNFVEDTLGSKRTGQESAQRFLDEQIADYEKRLTDAENQLADFKKRNVGQMPDERGDYFARLQTELIGVDQVQKSLAIAEARRNELNRQLSGEDPFVFGFDANASANDAASGAAGDITARIQEMEHRLEELLLRYTEKHPEIVALRKTIGELQKRQQEELARVRQGEAASGDMASSLKTNPVYQSIEVELKRTQVQVAELRQDLAQRQSRVGQLRAHVNTVPEVEAELTRLNRDYEVTKGKYLDLVQRRETAKISEDADRTGVVKFEVIDPPAVGLQPVAPNRPMLLAGVFLAALGAGFAVAFLLSQLRPVFQNARVLADFTGLPVIGVVSNTWLERYKLEARRHLMVFSGAAALLVVTFGVVLMFVNVGTRLVERFSG